MNAEGRYTALSTAESGDVELLADRILADGPSIRMIAGPRSSRHPSGIRSRVRAGRPACWATSPSPPAPWRSTGAGGDGVRRGRDLAGAVAAAVCDAEAERGGPFAPEVVALCEAARQLGRPGGPCAGRAGAGDQDRRWVVSWDPVHDSRRAFLCCMRAQCAPGTVVGPVPLPGLVADPRLDAAAAVLLTLLDTTTPVAACGTAARQAVAAVRAVTGSPLTGLPEAEFVLVAGDPAEAIRRAPRGDRDRPERGATVVVVAADVRETLTLAGPGIPGRRSSAVALGGDARRERERANSALPCGVDLLLVGDDGVRPAPVRHDRAPGAACRSAPGRAVTPSGC